VKILLKSKLHHGIDTHLIRILFFFKYIKEKNILGKNNNNAKAQSS
jgi:hypothetical protein